MTKVKICGMMREEDLDLASHADYLGFVIESESRRSLSVQRAKDLMRLSSQKNVAVLTSQDPKSIQGLIDRLDPDVVQLHSSIGAHGIEEVVKHTHLPIWALISVGSGVEERRAQEICHAVDALLLDSHTNVLGGSGITHDWAKSRMLRDHVHPLPVVLSGGLRAGNVGKAISEVAPTIVDVSSGVEEKGMKSGLLIDRFIDAARRE